MWYKGLCSASHGSALQTHKQQSILRVNRTSHKVQISLSRKFFKIGNFSLFNVSIHLFRLFTTCCAPLICISFFDTCFQTSNASASLLSLLLYRSEYRLRCLFCSMTQKLYHNISKIQEALPTRPWQHSQLQKTQLEVLNFDWSSILEKFLNKNK